MIRDLVLLKLQAVGLRGARHLTPAELSGGMARRVLVQLIKRLNQALSLTSVVVSHDIKETLSIADYLYLIADGQVVAHGTPSSLEVNQDPRVSQFMHGEPDGPVPFHYPAETLYRDILGHDLALKAG